MPAPATTLFVFNKFGDLERSELRPSTVHSADGWRGILELPLSGTGTGAGAITSEAMQRRP